jgi:DNA-binding transcriptional ArsR family regulator
VALAEQVARFAAALAEPSRVSMCLALLDGRAWTATELARAAGIAPSTASEHLDRLVEAGLLNQVRQGRHRYVRLAGPEMAGVVEHLTALVSPAADAARAAPTSLRSVRANRRLATARTCYDHLAGGLGVGLLDAFVAAGHLSVRDGLAVTSSGREWFTAFVGPAPFLARSGRPLLRECLDWTERRHHLGGALGAAVCRELIEREWLLRAAGERAVALTDAGRAGLAGLLGDIAPLTATG